MAPFKEVNIGIEVDLIKERSPEYLNARYLPTVVGQAVSRDILRIALTHPDRTRESRVKLRDTLNQRLQGKLPQFPKRPASAPAKMLEIPALEGMLKNVDLAVAVLRAWADAYDELIERARRFLRDDMGLEAAGMTPEGEFSGWLDWFEYEGAMERYSKLYPEDDRSMIPAAFMYASGMLFAPSDGSDFPEPLSDWLAHLDELPLSSRAWLYMPRFVEILRREIESKKETLFEAGALKEGLTDIHNRFDEEIRFIEREPIDPAEYGPRGSFAESKDAAVAAMNALIAYRKSNDDFENATSLSEQRRAQSEAWERADKAGELYDALLDSLAKLPEAEREDGQAPASNSKSAAGEIVGLEAENQRLSEENAALTDRVSALSSDSDDLRAERDSLRESSRKLGDRLRKSTDMERVWREAYESAMRSEGAEVELDPDAIENLEVAVRSAALKCEGRLSLALNNQSNVSDNAYERVGDVYRMLVWLGNDYYCARLGEREIRNFDASVKSVCANWSYKAFQSPTAMRKFPAAYTTEIDGRKFTLEKHLASGVSNDERHTIRIGFEWDAENSSVVVGYIGKHQPTMTFN